MDWNRIVIDFPNDSEIEPTELAKLISAALGGIEQLTEAVVTGPFEVSEEDMLM